MVLEVVDNRMSWPLLAGQGRLPLESATIVGFEGRVRANYTLGQRLYSMPQEQMQRCCACLGHWKELKEVQCHWSSGQACSRIQLERWAWPDVTRSQFHWGLCKSFKEKGKKKTERWSESHSERFALGPGWKKLGIYYVFIGKECTSVHLTRVPWEIIQALLTIWFTQKETVTVSEHFLHITIHPEIAIECRETLKAFYNHLQLNWWCAELLKLSEVTPESLCIFSMHKNCWGASYTCRSLGSTPRDYVFFSRRGLDSMIEMNIPWRYRCTGSPFEKHCFRSSNLIRLQLCSKTEK